MDQPRGLPCRPSALPRAWVAHRTKLAHSQEEAIRLTLDPATDLRTTVVLDREIPIELCQEAAAVKFTAIDEQHFRRHGAARGTEQEHRRISDFRRFDRSPERRAIAVGLQDARKTRNA